MVTLPSEHEVLTEFCTPGNAVRRILELEAEGWRLLCTQPTIRVYRTATPPYNHPNVSSTAALVKFNSDGSWVYTGEPPVQYHQPIPPDDYGYVDSIQLIMVKKKWEQDPCPRCNHPYPDDSRIDRDI